MSPGLPDSRLPLLHARWKRAEMRVNFQWHRRPFGMSGKPRKSATPSAGKAALSMNFMTFRTCDS